MKPLSVDALVRLFGDGTELAIIDPREEGDFAHAHLLAATNLPFSRLELLIRRAVPKHATRIVLVDDTGGAVERSAAILSAMGYTELYTLSGGIAAWHASGLPLFSGINVPGKAFGEYVDQHLCPPAISAADLRRRFETGLETILIDTRTPEEHARYCVPGAMLCPNGELAIRALGMIAEKGAPVVVHCGGRTRSIIAAQTLIDLGVSHPVFALENGTIAWAAMGGELERGADRILPDTPSGRDAGRVAAKELARKSRAREIDATTLRAMRDQLDRTTVIIDVRTAEEFSAGHVAGARHVPGGQLIQGIDNHLVVRNARVVLTDDDGTRAHVVAFWLMRMGLTDVSVYPAEAEARRGTVEDAEAREGAEAPVFSPSETVIDIRDSLSYRRGHIPGSWYLSRRDLSRDLGGLPPCESVALITDDAEYASLMKRDLAASRISSRIILDGFDRWRDRGGAIETGLERLASPPSDRAYFGHDMEWASDAERENRRYIRWEKGLIEDIADDPSVRYLQTIKEDRSACQRKSTPPTPQARDAS